MTENRIQQLQKRLERLQVFLTNEENSDKPAQTYIDDLKISIQTINKQLASKINDVVFV